MREPTPMQEPSMLPRFPVTEDNVQLYIMQSLAEIGTQLRDMRIELLGNGQPGRIQVIEAEHTELRKKVDSIKSRITYAAGLAVGISATIELIVKFIK